MKKIDSFLILTTLVVTFSIFNIKAQPLQEQYTGQQKRIIALVEQITSKAFDKYQNLDMDGAVKLLQDAIKLCNQNGIGGEVLAKTYLNLAIIYILGYNNLKKGEEEMEKAAEINPDIEPNPLYTTPIISQMWTDIVAKKRKEKQTSTEPLTPPSITTIPLVQIIHTPVTEQLPDHPIPIYAEVMGEISQESRMVVSYKSPELVSYLHVPMYRYKNGFAAKIPCKYALDNTNVEYYISLYDKNGNLISSLGSNSNPFVVIIHSPLQGSPPHLPELPPETVCSEEELGREKVEKLITRYFYIELIPMTGGGVPFGKYQRISPCYTNTTPPQIETIKVNPSFVWTPFAFGIETGAYIGPNFGVGVWGRYQIPVGRDKNKEPKNDWAVELRGRWYFLPRDPLRMWITFGTGIGLLHHRIEINSTCDAGKIDYKYCGGINGKDTPGFWVSLGLNLIYNPIRYVGFGPTGEFHVIFPELGLQLDFGLKLQFGY